MQQIFHCIHHITERVGKRNIVLFLVIMVALVVSGLYATFSLSVTSENVSIAEGVKTFHFVLGDSSLENSVIIASGSSKNIAITVSNREKIPLLYGIYYSSSDELKDVELGYHHSTEYLPNGIIEPEKDYIVTIQVDNQTDHSVMLSFGVIYGLEKGGELVLGVHQHFLDAKWGFSLSEVEKGKYIRYVGNNGCLKGQCEGVNINYADSSHQGYCGDMESQFSSSGWRVAYTRKGYVYLISASAPECVEQYEMDVNDFQERMDELALRYCNIDYAYQGICNRKSAWAMNNDDYYYIVGSKLNEYDCLEDSSRLCGYENDLMDIGSFYYVSNAFSKQMFYYHPMFHYFSYQALESLKGIRPVLKLSSSIVVVGGKGTEDDPYLIENTVLPQYDYSVVYYGNGATGGNTSDSYHQTNVLKSLSKNEYTLTYQVKLDEIANFDDSYCDVEGVCYESSVPSILTKEAKFLGWSLKDDSDVVQYQDEEEVMNLSSSSEEVVVSLYAVWEYDVFRLPDIQKRDGYEVLGWYTEKDGGEKIGNPGDAYSNSDKITLYARWEEKSS